MPERYYLLFVKQTVLWPGVCGSSPFDKTKHPSLPCWNVVQLIPVSGAITNVTVLILNNSTECDQ